MKIYLLTLFFFFICCGSDKLPDYIEKCSFSDPHINDCIVNQANKALPRIFKGDAKYGIPPMNPLKWKNLTIAHTNELKFRMKNVTIYGMENFRIESTLYNRKDVKTGIILSCSSLSFVGDYNIDGVVLYKAIHGRGVANITLENSLFKWIATPLKILVKDNMEYFHWENEDIRFVSAHQYYNFQNLFEGNKIKGQEMNEFLNKNWGEISEIFEVGIGQFIAKLISQIDLSYIKNVPIVEIFNP